VDCEEIHSGRRQTTTTYKASTEQLMTKRMIEKLNNFPEWIRTSVKMFADDTKLWTRISTLEDSHILQDDLDKLMCWSDKWKLGFNPQKCKTMHIGH